MLLDIGAALITLVLLSNYFGISITVFSVLLVICVFLLPDIDIFAEYLVHKQIGGKATGIHREYTHYPLLYIPFLGLIFVMFGSFWFLLLLFGVLFHFIHDSIGLGWGIKWLWPISKKSYKILHAPIDTKQDKAINLITSWNPIEHKRVIKTHGDDDWIKNYYFNLTSTLVIELGILILGILIFVYYVLI